MTLEVVGARPAFSEEPLGGSTADRLARLPEIVDELRRDDAAAERDRVLQYGAVEQLRHAGVAQPSGARAATAGPAAGARDVLTAVIQIARGSSNVAQALRAHFGFSERLLSNRASRGRTGAVVPAW